MPSLFAHSLFARQNPLDEARITLSSWDNCMAKAYCKWPVIVAIIVGSLILISVITCIARCICCGAELACCCFRCCTCCCSGSGGRGHKRVKSDPAAQYPTPYGAPPQPNPYAQNPYAQAHAAAPPAPPIDTRPINQQYRSNAMPTFTPHAAAQPERPQFATFDSTRAVVNEDALPAMPTWKDGRDVHVQVEEQPVPQKQGDMELDRLDRNGSVTSGSMGGGMVAAAAVPAKRPSPGPGRSPVSPMDNYGYPQGGYQNESFVSEGAPLNNQGGYGRPYAQQDEYRRASPAYAAGDGYGQPQQQPYGRRSPGAAQAYDSREQLSQYNQQGPGAYGQQVPQTYDQRDYYDEHVDQRYQSPSPPGPANPYNNNNNNNNNYNSDPYTSNPSPSYHSHENDAYAPPQAPAALQPGYPASQSTDHASFTNAAPAYPGQRSYTPVGGSVAGAGGQQQQQQPYRAFSPLAQGDQVQRKPVQGSFREI
ncbi:hypothetical protein J4E82_010930 [Alternaria postmessia]|uniref:uncharacterized protein n=1 Tax=Alternaria postmessia TaxID=1187938 RepID=UPI002224B7F8|nr:uncharacterized protein J4E82_010930 [Alternaria postmessia]KAI5366962.1 hypothetical protein J4E82_010930 [Alternaria postmessia]